MSNTSPRKKPSQPAIFWVTISLAGVSAILLGVRIFRAEVSGTGDSFLVGIAISLLLVVALFAWFAIRIGARMRAAGAALPGAFRVPVVVGPALAAATAAAARELGSPSVRLRSSTYATVAFDADGMHVVKGFSPPFGLIPASQISVKGVGRTLVGSRETEAVAVSYAGLATEANLLLVPMRLRGNPLRLLTDADMREVCAQVAAALSGSPVHETDWPY